MQKKIVKKYKLKQEVKNNLMFMIFEMMIFLVFYTFLKTL